MKSETTLSTAARSAEALVAEPQVDAEVTRQSDGAWRFTWRLAAERVAIFAGTTPDLSNPGQSVAQVENTRQARLPATAVPPAMMPRPYFRLQFYGGAADGETRLVAERSLPLDGGVNFRDIGGYRTQDGRCVRWGRIYRSGLLARLSDADLEFLDRLDLKLVCDLRSESEAARLPNRLPGNPGPHYRPLHMVTSMSRWRQMLAVFRKRHALDELMLEGYTRIVVDENAGIIGDLLRLMADSANLPLVIHCTAGKDRTGMAVALLLAALGVPDETIVADYTLSNRHYAAYAPTLARDVRRLARLGLDNAHIQPVLVANGARMEAALAHVRRQYGSVHTYLQDAAGVEAAALQQLRRNLLS